MTHILGVYEGYYDSFEKFMNFFHGRTYQNANAKVRARIMIPINFGVNECGREEFLKDLKSFSRIETFNLKGDGWINRQNTGQGLKNKMKKMFKWMRRIFPQVKDIEKDMEIIESSELRKKEQEKGNHFLGCFYPIGEVKDARYKDGSEVI